MYLAMDLKYMYIYTHVLELKINFEFKSEVGMDIKSKEISS